MSIAVRKKFAPVLENLESLVALSAAHGLAATAVATTGPQLSAQLHGHYSLYSSRLAGVSKTLSIVGSAEIPRFGRTYFAGNFRNADAVNQGQPTGDLALFNLSGSVTLHLVGPASASPSPTATTFRYSTTGNSGTFHAVTSPGTATLTLIPNHGKGGVITPNRGNYQLDVTSDA